MSDEDAADIDYDELLEEMQDDIRDANPDREAAGYGTIELLGWAEAPHYDATSKKLYWAKELRFDGSDETTLNYEIRALGRRGILTMTFIAAGSQLAASSRACSRQTNSNPSRSKARPGICRADHLVHFDFDRFVLGLMRLRNAHS